MGMTEAPTLSSDKENSEIASLQAAYSKIVYESPAPLPPHLVDYFVLVATSLAKHKTALAQGLTDAGFLMLISVIEKDKYPYPEAEDYEPPHVRKILRQQMCEEATKALSDRLYLAAQKQLLYRVPQAQSTAPPASEAARAKWRRRPSWMATGG